MSRFSSYFNRTTINALARKGIAITGLQAIPKASAMPFSEAQTGYVLDDNGTCRVCTHAEVVKLVQ